MSLFFTEGNDIKLEDKWTVPDLLSAMPTINPKLENYPNTLAFLLKEENLDQLITYACKQWRIRTIDSDIQAVTRENTCCENATRFIASNPILLSHALNDGRVVTTFVTCDGLSAWTASGLFSVIDAMTLNGERDKLLEKIKELGGKEEGVIGDLEVLTRVFLKHVDKYQAVTIENLVKFFSRIAPEDPSPLVSLVTKFLVDKIVYENSISAVDVFSVLQARSTHQYRLDHPEVVTLILKALLDNENNGNPEDEESKERNDNATDKESNACKASRDPSHSLVSLLENFLTSSHVLIDVTLSPIRAEPGFDDFFEELDALASSSTEASIAETKPTTTTTTTTSTEPIADTTAAATLAATQESIDTTNTSQETTKPTTLQEATTTTSDANVSEIHSSIDNFNDNFSEGSDDNSNRNNVNNENAENNANNNNEDNDDDEWSSYAGTTTGGGDDDDWGDWEGSPAPTTVASLDAMTDFDDWDISATYHPNNTPLTSSPAPPIRKETHPLVKAILGNLKDGCNVLTSPRSTHRYRLSLLRIYEKLLDLPADCDNQVLDAFTSVGFFDTLLHVIFAHPSISVVQSRALQIIKLIVRKNNFLLSLLSSSPLLSIVGILLKNKTAQTFSELDEEQRKLLQESVPSVPFHNATPLPAHVFNSIALDLYEASSNLPTVKSIVDSKPGFSVIWMEIASAHFQRKTALNPWSADDDYSF